MILARAGIVGAIPLGCGFRWHGVYDHAGGYFETTPDVAAAVELDDAAIMRADTVFDKEVITYLGVGEFLGEVF